MASYKNFKNKKLNNINNKDPNKRPKSMVKEVELSQQKRDNLISWITFYRRNIHRFVQHYLGIELHPYQIFFLYWMSITDSFTAIAARASAKTFLLGIYAVAKAILYPGSLIVVVALSKEQAGIILSEKIVGLKNTYPNVAREIKNIVTSMNQYECQFHNGSTIRVVPSRDSARGKRASMLIMEEFRLIDKVILDSVIIPFLAIRQTPYLKNPKYSHLIEQPQEVYISSAYHRGLWWWNHSVQAIQSLAKGDNVGFIALDYLIAIKHNIKTALQIKRDKLKMDSITYLEEYENIAWGESGAAYFKLNMFLKARNMKKAFYPRPNDQEFQKKNIYDITKVDGEIRLISVDVSTRAGRTNDLTIITLFRLIPTNRGYHRHVSYVESHSGQNIITQALRIKQLHYDFSGDIIVIDIANNGVSLYDSLGVLTLDEERGIEYPPLTIMIHPEIDEKVYEELSHRTLATNAQPIIFPITATASLNSKIAVSLRTALKKKLFSFLTDEKSAEEYLFQNQKEIIRNEDEDSMAFFMNPFVQTSLMIGECVNLNMTVSNGNIKLVEPVGGRKDRYTSLSYGNYYVGLMDIELLKESDDDSDDWINSTMML